MALSSLAPLAALVALLAACYETPQPPCAFQCGQSGECPAEYSCRADSWCVRNDLADDYVCAAAVIDASAGTTADGSSIGDPDGSASPADAAPSDPDAARVDAAPGPPDAAPPDAPLPDASAPDAMAVSLFQTGS